MSWFEEALEAIGGSILMAAGDKRAFNHFDLSEPGFWRSFSAIAVVAPLYLYASRVDYQLALAAAEDKLVEPVSVPVVLFALAVQWLVWPLAMVPIARLIGQSRHYARYITVYNWSSILVIAASLPAFVLFQTGLIGHGATLALAAMVLFATLAYRWITARLCLEIPGPIAAALVLGDIALSYMVARLFS